MLCGIYEKRVGPRADCLPPCMYTCIVSIHKVGLAGILAGRDGCTTPCLLIHGGEGGGGAVHEASYPTENVLSSSTSAHIDVLYEVEFRSIHSLEDAALRPVCKVRAPTHTTF